MLVMPKFPGLSGQDIARALERLGIELIRQSGSHIIMRRDISGCVVPNRDDVFAQTGAFEHFGKFGFLNLDSHHATSRF